MKYIITTVLLLLVSGVASAHSVWLEKHDDNSAKIYFGNWHSDLREPAEKLKRFESAKVFLQDETKAVSLKLGENHLKATIDTTAGDVRMINISDPKKHERTGEVRKSHNYAKAGRQETTAAMDFEIVPVTSNSNKFVVFFKGKPLAKARIIIHGPTKWRQDFRSNESGEFTINTPWTGTYIIRTSHTIEPEEGKSSLENPILRHSFSLIMNH